MTAMRCGGCAILQFRVSSQHALLSMFYSTKPLLWLSSIFLYAVNQNEVFKIVIALQWFSLHCRDKSKSAGVCAFFVVGVACTKQVSCAPVHVQVCNRCLSTPEYIYVNKLSEWCAHAPVYV